MNELSAGRLHAITTYATPELRDDAGQLIAVLEGRPAAEALRLAACWNACQNVPTHILEANPAPFGALREERDILLSAARKALWALAHAANANPLYQAEYEALDVAFRRAAGSPPAAGINEQAEGD